MLYAYVRTSLVRLRLCVLFTASLLLLIPQATLLAQPAESLSTGVIPTMGINDPFAAIVPGGPLRYVVIAETVEGMAKN